MPRRSWFQALMQNSGGICNINCIDIIIITVTKTKKKKLKTKNNHNITSKIINFIYQSSDNVLEWLVSTVVANITLLNELIRIARHYCRHARLLILPVYCTS